jgi:cytochrome c553
MKRLSFIALFLLSCLGFAAAQAGYSPSTDVLGAHLNYGRGCAACHSPHSGSYGNGQGRTADPNSGTVALWGEEVSSLFGRTITTDGGKFVEVLPTSMTAGTPDAMGMLTCLSCHDGNYGTTAMMKNKVYETLPANYGSVTVPTLLGKDGGVAGNYLSEHPVGLSAKISCGTSNWDCTQTNGVVSMKGANSSRFVTNYGFFVKPGAYNNTAVIVCTTCHDPHVMSVVKVTKNSTSGLPAGNYATMFFLRGPYNPASSTAGSNQTAQFCRQCHANESNEMNGSSAGTIF